MNDRDTFTRHDGMRISLTPTEAMIVDILTEIDVVSAGTIVEASKAYRDPPGERQILHALDILETVGVLVLNDSTYTLAPSR